MAFVPDVSALDGVARRIDGHAEQLRRRAHELRVATDQVQWHSTGAQAFRHRAFDLAADLNVAAEAVAAAATTLRHHAESVRQHATAVTRWAGVLCPPLAIAEALL